MHGVRLNLATSMLLLLASACVIAPAGEDEASSFEAVPSSLEMSAGLEEASMAEEGSREGEAELRDRLPVPKADTLRRLDSAGGPTPDPWHSAQPGGCSSGPTPDPWTPGSGSEGDGRSGSTAPDQGSSQGGTKPKG